MSLIRKLICWAVWHKYRVSHLCFSGTGIERRDDGALLVTPHLPGGDCYQIACSRCGKRMEEPKHD